MKNYHLGKLAFALMAAATVFVACHKTTTTPTTTTTTTTAGLYYHSITFNDSLQFFSTKTGGVPMDSNKAKKVASTIDITYMFDPGYWTAGFLDPVTRSNKSGYWASLFYTYWSNVSVSMQWYGTKYNDFNGSIFNAAVTNQAQIGKYFADTANVFLAPGGSLSANGTFAGGRPGYTNFNQYSIVAFKRLSDGKRGLIRILSTINQPISDATTVDIVMEH